MTDSADGESVSGPGADQRGVPRPSFTPARPSSSPARTHTQGPEVCPDDEGSPAHPVTRAAQSQPAGAPGWERTGTATGGSWPAGTTDPGQASSWDSRTVTAPGPGSPEARYASGAAGASPVRQGAVGQEGSSAEEVWRTGLLPGRHPRRGPWRRVWTALTAALLIACGVVVYLRLHHAPLSVTGVVITSQARNGCTVDVTGRISTNGGAGTVSYQWVLSPQGTAPHPLSQSVLQGQSAVYVTVSDQGTGHGQAVQEITLQVLGPGQRSASTHVKLSC